MSWGKAHQNNNIGHGQGAANSVANGWGYAHREKISPGGETVLFGLNDLTAQTYFNTRVTADGGTVESLTCITII